MKINILTLALLVLNFCIPCQGQTVLNDFTVDPSSYYPSGSPFVADKIVGNYSQVSTLDPGGTFSVSMKWITGQFVKNDGVDAISGIVTGSGFAYQPYALIDLSGNWIEVAGTAQFEFTSGSFNMYLDQDVNTNFTAPVSGFSPHTTTGNSDDILLLTGSISTALSSAGVNASTGIFGTGAFIKYFDFSLTSAGEDFFTDPTPFYSLMSFDGQYNVAGYTGTVSNNGSADLKFVAPVPEPGSGIAVMLGAALLMAQRQRKPSTLC